jgi:integrase
MIKARDQLKMVFRYAMSKGDVSRNPTEGIKMPIPLKPTKDVKPPEEDAQEKLCAALTSMHNDKPIYRLGWAGVLLLETGMRVGELLASEWCDLSKDGYELFIHQTLETVHGKTSIYPSTKTEEGTRYVQLNQRARQAVQKLREVTGKWEYLTATENGTLTTYRNFERMIETACARAKIDKLSCHPLRHAFASNAEKRGASSRDIAAQLGHTNDTLVRTRYSSIYEADRRESMRRATGD